MAEFVLGLAAPVSKIVVDNRAALRKVLPACVHRSEQERESN